MEDKGNSYLCFHPVASSSGLDDAKVFPNTVTLSFEEFADLMKERSIKNEVYSVLAFGVDTIDYKEMIVRCLVSIIAELRKLDEIIMLKCESQCNSYPEDREEAYILKEDDEIDLFLKKMENLPRSDVLKILVVTDRVTILISVLPPFPRFGSEKQVMRRINGWEVLRNPKDYAFGVADAFIFCDLAYETENLALSLLMRSKIIVNDQSPDIPVNTVPLKELIEESVHDDSEDEPIPNDIHRTKRKKRRRHTRKDKEDDISLPKENQQTFIEDSMSSKSASEIEASERSSESSDVSESEPDPTEVIKEFVSKTELNIPSLRDTAIFSTLFQQLFYEKWKSETLLRVKAAVEKIQVTLSSKNAEELQSIRELINNPDVHHVVAREEKKLQLLEAKTLESLTELYSARFKQYESNTTRNLYRLYQSLAREQVECYESLFNMRKEVRSASLDLRKLQNERLEAMQAYQKHAEAVEKATALRKQLKELTDKESMVNEELDDLESVFRELQVHRDQIKQKLSNNTTSMHPQHPKRM